jgi:3-oxoacyl-[acyl-carrier protein] reductase
MDHSTAVLARQTTAAAPPPTAAQQDSAAALITGASREIGAAIAKRLAAKGASVAITFSKGADAEAGVVNAIERNGGKAIAIQATPTSNRASPATES